MPERVRARGVAVTRRGRRILDGIDLTIDAGAPFAIVGESGAGKSTLLFALVGLLPIDAGAIEIDGARLADLDARARARKVGIVFQDYQLFPHLDVRGNLELAPRLHGLDAPERRATDLLARLGLDGLAHRRPHELSGGQRQRVAIARSLALEPRVLFFDEPSAALDPRTTDELADMLASLSSRTQIVVVSHDRPFVERVARRGVRLAGGRVVAEGSPGELM